MFKNAPSLSYADLITGEKFAGICDRVLFHYKRNRWFFPHRQDRYFYSDTNHAAELLQRLPCSREVVVVTHNDDKPVDAALFSQTPDNVRAWYAQNVRHTDPRLHPVPIGLENESWFPELRKKQKILDARASGNRPSKLLYMNHAVWTNRAVRQPPYDLFGDKPWCTAAWGMRTSRPSTTT
jgi:hypothetical protein